MTTTTSTIHTHSTHVKTNVSVGSRPYDRSVPISSLLVLALAVFAMGVSSYLGYVGLTASKVAGCGGGVFNCDHVLSTKWSLWMGIPVGVMATGLYATMITAIVVSLLARSSRMNHLAMFIVVAAGYSAGAAALWFIGLQVFAIGHLCLWCLVAHSCGLIIATTLFIAKPLERRVPAMPTLAGLAGVAVLIAGQALAEPPQTYEVQTFPMADIEDDGTFGSPGDLLEDESMMNESAASEPDVFGAPVFDAPVFGAPVFEAPDSSPVNQQSQSTEVPEVSRITKNVNPPAMASLPPFIIVLMLSMFLQSLCGGSLQADDTQPKAETQKAENTVTFGGGIRLNRKDWPCVGTTNAKYVFVEMFDYTCPHCRETHHLAIKQLKSKYGKDLAIMTLPVPLNSKCNDTVQSTSAAAHNSCELARLAIAVWLTDREKFAEYHDWMFEPSSPRSTSDAKKQAEKIVDKERLNNILSQKVSDAYIKRHVQLYRKVGSGAVPKLLFQKTALVGKVSSADHISKVLEQQFGSR